MADFTVKLTITGDGTVAVKAVQDVGAAAGKMGALTRQAGAAAAEGLSITGTASANVAAELNKARNSAALLYGQFKALGGATAVAKSLMSAADSAGQLRARLQFATTSAEEYADVQARIEQVARSSYKSIEDVSEVFIRSAEPMRQLGMTSKDTLDLTEALSLGLVVSGANAEASASAIDAFGKAMQTGTLRGEEFKTVVERAPAFAQALEQALGKTRAELIGMANDGELTVQELVKVSGQLGDLRDKSEQMPATLEDAMTRFHTQWLKFADALNASTGGMNALVKGMDFLGDHISTVGVLLLSLASAHLAAKAQALLHDLAQRKVAASALAEAEAEMAKARAMFQVTGSTAALTVAETRLAAAQEAATAAGVGKIGVLSRMGSSLLSLAGGPIGIAVLAVGGLVAAWQASVRAEEERVAKFNAGVATTKKTTASIEELVLQLERARQGYDALPDFADAARKWAGATEELTAKQAELANKRAEIEALEYRVRAAQQSTTEGAGMVLLALVPKLEQVRGEYAALEGVVNALGGALSRLNFDQFFNPSAAQVAGDQSAQAFAQLTAGAKAAQAQIDKNKQGQIAYWQALANTRIEQARASGASAAQVAQMQAENAAMLETIGSTLKKEQATKAVRDAGADYIANLHKQVATYGLASDAVARYELSVQKLTPAQREQASALLDTLAEWDRYAAALKPAYEAIDNLAGGSADLDEQLAQGRERLAGLSATQIKYNAAVREANKLAREALALGPPTAAVQKEIEDRLKKLGELRDQDTRLEDTAKHVADIDALLGKFAGNDDGIGSINDALVTMQDELDKVGDRMSAAFDPERAKQLQAAIGNARYELANKFLGATKQSLQGLQSLTSEGSRSFAALQVMIDATTLAEAVLAVVHQLSAGDVYSAIPRAAAVAAAIASLGVSIGNFAAAGGPSSQSAEVRQAQQGTGTVLGDATAKSESIARAVEITADATTKLVGLNRGMLSALQALQNALGAAGNQLARGAGNAAFPGLQDNTGFPISSPLLDLHMSDPISKAINGFLFGGAQKIIDQGIVIAGGALRDMLDQIVVGAYQTIHQSGGLLGSDKTFDNVTDISDSFGKQFQLVIKSIADTVRQGALALGLLPDDIEAALANFRVEEIRISLKGLSAEDQQKELEAVFSSLFDGLAGSVVPFIAQFQAVGEGLGETLVRIATEVQVAQEAFKQLGLAVDEADPERFAQISDALIQAAGGLDAFISGMQSFVANFAPESHQFAVASDALNSALSQVGLSVPATRDGMWALMQSLDATTESGRAQIATLLRLADVADAYYSALDKQTAEATKLLDSMGLLTNGLSDFGRGLVSIKAQEASAIDAANTLAKAQGRTGASSMQLAAIHTWTAKQIAAAIRQLQVETRDLIAKLYGGVPGSLDAINDRIRELESASQQFGDSAGSAIDSVADASAQLFESWKSGVKSVQDYLDSMLLGDLSALTPEEQLAEAQRQLIAMQEAAMGGDAEALNQLPQLADAYLRLLRGSVASGGDYNAGFDWVRQLLQSVVDMPNPGTEGNGNTGGGGGGTTTVVASPELQALYAARDAALAAQEAEYRRQLAQDLTQHLSDLATALNVPIFELIEAQGVNLAQLATDLGADLANLNAASIEALGGMATTLGVPLAELVQQLGLSMPDLKEGLVELTQSLGIDLSALTGTTAGQLAALAGSLGGNLRDLSTALGIDLGKLIDVNSPIFVALKDNIGDLSPDIRAELDPLLKAVGDASGDEAKNAAVKALRDHVDKLAPDIKRALGPYFDDIMPQSALTQLDYLDDINRIAGEQLTALGQINNNLAAANREAGIASYAVGTGNVPSDGLAMIHQGEAIIPAPFAAWMRSNGIPVVRGGAANDDSRVERAVIALREEVAALRRENGAGHRYTAEAVSVTGKQAYIQRDEIQRKNATGGRGQ